MPPVTDGSMARIHRNVCFVSKPFGTASAQPWPQCRKAAMRFVSSIIQAIQASSWNITYTYIPNHGGDRSRMSP